MSDNVAMVQGAYEAFGRGDKQARFDEYVAPSPALLAR